MFVFGFIRGTILGLSLGLMSGLIAKKICPAIFFKINPINCLNVFKYIVNQLKDEQEAKYPYHYDDKDISNCEYIPVPVKT